MGNVVEDLPPQRPQPLGQQHRGRNPVHVVVSVDEDRLATGQGFFQEVDGAVHVADTERVVAGLQSGLEIGPPGVHVRDSAADHQFGHDLRDAQGGTQGRGAIPIGYADGDALRIQHGGSS